jgi:demethylmenaquinone methyltransferase/2-methoxy-6-polyprenyl-1,4-benzoquinol methylase
MNSDSHRSAEVLPELRPHRDLEEFYHGRNRRAEFVSRLFDNTACHYDRISGALSFGTCKAYRRRALRCAGLEPGMRMLDVATGTGLAAQAALDLGVSPAHLVGLDPSRGMLRENRKLRTIPLVQGLGESLPFPGASFDFICMGYALRHVEDLRLLFDEFHRVLKPGGRVLILEITRPDSRLGFLLGKLYLSQCLSALARLLTRNRDAGQLLKFYWATIAECVPPKIILAALASSGLTQVERRKTGSLLSDYFAIKPPNPLSNT